MRKTIEVTRDAPGTRDHGKTFVITEMSATQAADWATRALFYIAQGGVSLPEEILSGGMESVAFLGISFLSAVDVELARPLLNELYQCVQIKEQHVTRKPTDDDVEDYQTILWLRGEVLKLHTGFSLAGDQSRSISQTQASAS